MSAPLPPIASETDGIRSGGRAAAEEARGVRDLLRSAPSSRAATSAEAAALAHPIADRPE